MTIRGVVLASIAGCFMAGGASAQLISPGFEQGPDVGEMSFDGTDTQGTGWYASNTDGERFKDSAKAWEGDYYAALLQNAGAYNGAPLGVGNFGASGFDRIYTNFLLDPSESYTVSFMHASDGRFGYMAATTVVEVVDTDTNATLAQYMVATPGLFDWQPASFDFSAVGSTGKISLAFTTMGSISSSVILDGISVKVVPAPGALALIGAAGLVTGRRRR